MDLLAASEHVQALADFKNPFLKSSVVCIRVRGESPSKWRSDLRPWYGCVEFVNGSTKGEQEFRGETIADVVTAIKLFIEALP